MAMMVMTQRAKQLSFYKGDDVMSRVLTTSNGTPISESNPLPVKMLGGGGGVDADDVYTKEETDDKFQEKGDYATTSDLNEKADKTELESKANTSDLDDKANKSELNDKASQSDLQDLIDRVIELEGSGD